VKPRQARVLPGLLVRGFQCVLLCFVLRVDVSGLLKALRAWGRVACPVPVVHRREWQPVVAIGAMVAMAIAA